MKFKVGDKVNVKKEVMFSLPHLTEAIKNGGIITDMGNIILVKFPNNKKYYFFPSTLEMITKNQQLLFGFME